MRVERAEGLVHQQHLGVVRERAGYRGALAHSARELVRLRVGELFEADARKVVHRYIAAALRIHSRKFGAERNVVGDGAPRQQRIFLKDHAALLARARDGRALV